MLSNLSRIKTFSKVDGVFDFVNPHLFAANVEALAYSRISNLPNFNFYYAAML